MKIGDKYKCLRTINNMLGQPLYIEGKTYTIIGIDEPYITLNHILYANEYMEIDFLYLLQNFEELNTGEIPDVEN